MLEVHLLQCPLETRHLQVLLLLKGLGEREEGAVGRDTPSSHKENGLQDVKRSAAAAATALSLLQSRPGRG